MARRRRSYKKTKCPEPINTMIDLAGAVTLGMYAKHKIKKDFEKGEGIESAKAASMVFGLGAMRGGSRGIINLGGLIGVNSALKDIEKEQNAKYSYIETPYIDKPSNSLTTTIPHIKKNLWRDYCEDGKPYGIDPYDFETPDEYNDALIEAKKCVIDDTLQHTPQAPTYYNKQETTEKKYVWRKYCEDGSAYGVNPMNYETADDYEEALIEAKKQNKN